MIFVYDPNRMVVIGRSVTAYTVMLSKPIGISFSDFDFIVETFKLACVNRERSIDDPDLALILKSFLVDIPPKLYRRAELKVIKTGIRVFMQGHNCRYIFSKLFLLIIERFSLFYSKKGASFGSLFTSQVANSGHTTRKIAAQLFLFVFHLPTEIYDEPKRRSTKNPEKWMDCARLNYINDLCKKLGV